MSLPNITKELVEILDHFEPIAKEAYPNLDRGRIFNEVEKFSSDWIYRELVKAMEEFRRKRNHK